MLSGKWDKSSREYLRFVCLGDVYEAVGDLFDRLVHGRFYLVWVT